MAGASRPGATHELGDCRGLAASERALEDALPRPAHCREVGVTRMELEAQQGVAALADGDERVPRDRHAAPPAARRAVDDALARDRIASRKMDQLAQCRRVV